MQATASPPSPNTPARVVDADTAIPAASSVVTGLHIRQMLMPQMGDTVTDHADVGYLSWSQFDRFRAAVHHSMILVPWLHAAGYIKGEVNEIRSPSTDHPLGLPPTWLAAEEISRLSGELRYWANLEDVANDDYGADVARQFTREVETAAARWPIEDKGRPVRHLRCQSCSGETIRYDPPRFQDDTVKIACTECARTYTDDEFTTLVELVTAEMKRAEVKVGSTRRLGAA